MISIIKIKESEGENHFLLFFFHFPHPSLFSQTVIYLLPNNHSNYILREYSLIVGKQVKDCWGKNKKNLGYARGQFFIYFRWSVWVQHKPGTDLRETYRTWLQACCMQCFVVITFTTLHTNSGKVFLVKDLPAFFCLPQNCYWTTGYLWMDEKKTGRSLIIFVVITRLIYCHYIHIITSHPIYHHVSEAEICTKEQCLPLKERRFSPR